VVKGEGSSEQELGNNTFNVCEDHVHTFFIFAIIFMDLG
jgi:hypothetical protein